MACVVDAAVKSICPQCSLTKSPLFGLQDLIRLLSFLLSSMAVQQQQASELREDPADLMLRLIREEEQGVLLSRLQVGCGNCVKLVWK